MDFNYIVLTRKEYKRLKALSRAPSGLDSGPNESTLMNKKLIDRNHYGPSSVSVINDRGKNYLLFRKQQRKEWLWNNGIAILNTLLALIAAIASIIALLQ